MKKVWIFTAVLLVITVLAGCASVKPQTVRDLTVQIPSSLQVQEKSDGFQAKTEKDEIAGLQIITGSENNPLEMTSEEYTSYTDENGKTIGDSILESAVAARGDSTKVLLNEKITVAGLPAVHVKYSFNKETYGLIYRDELSLLYKGVIYEISRQWSDKTSSSVSKALEAVVTSIQFK